MPVCEEQAEKGYKYLLNLWKTPAGKERKNKPFSYRERAILIDWSYSSPIYFNGFYQYGNINACIATIYDIGFEYYVANGIHIIG